MVIGQSMNCRGRGWALPSATLTTHLLYFLPLPARGNIANLACLWSFTPHCEASLQTPPSGLLPNLLPYFDNPRNEHCNKYFPIRQWKQPPNKHKKSKLFTQLDTNLLYECSLLDSRLHCMPYHQVTSVYSDSTRWLHKVSGPAVLVFTMYYETQLSVSQTGVSGWWASLPCRGKRRR